MYINTANYVDTLCYDVVVVDTLCSDNYVCYGVIYTVSSIYINTVRPFNAIGYVDTACVVVFNLIVNIS